MQIDLEKEQQAAKLRGSLLEFSKFFFLHVRNRPFVVPQPVGRKTHVIEIMENLTKLTRCENTEQCLNINICPGSYKSTILQLWVAWCFTQYPDCNFFYTSFSAELVLKATTAIKDIMTSPMYKYLFGVELQKASKSNKKFTTTALGTVNGAGILGTITGFDAGIAEVPRFGGALIIDDSIKVLEALSDVILAKANNSYEFTLRERLRSAHTPIVNIGQRAHENDIAGKFFIPNNDVFTWKNIVIPTMDGANNSILPKVHTVEKMLLLKEKTPYVYASQHQQDPIPAGGAIFRREWFKSLFEEPEIVKTFITADTAETDKEYNDATVFSFWGIYEIENFGKKNGELGIHWIDCVELRIEPKDLKDEFIDFWHACYRHKCPPKIAAIEKKSTGTTLLSVLKEEIQGLRLIDIDRNRSSGSKAKRFMESQYYVSSHQVTFTEGARHMGMCVDHMAKITGNNTHRFDDIADTCADAIRIALIDKSLYNIDNSNTQTSNTAKELNALLLRKVNLRNKAYG